MKFDQNINHGPNCQLKHIGEIKYFEASFEMLIGLNPLSARTSGCRPLAVAGSRVQCVMMTDIMLKYPVSSWHNLVKISCRQARKEESFYVFKTDLKFQTNE